MTSRILAPIALAAAWLPQPAHAVTECDQKISTMFTGDSVLYIMYVGGGSAYITSTDPDFTNTISFALTAFLSSRPIVVRYSADGVSCTASDRTDLIGIWIR